MVSHVTANGLDLFAWAGLRKPRELDERSDGSARTVDEAFELELLEEREPEAPGVSGLPLVCSNCGVSFFSLQIPDDQVDCYCSGECKWSVIMYREMDLRLFALRRRAAHGAPSCASSSYDSDEDSVESVSFSDDDSTACSSCS